MHLRGVEVKLTGAFHALVYETIEQRAAVVTERGTGVGVDLECVSTLEVLEGKRSGGEESQRTEMFTNEPVKFLFTDVLKTD